MTAFAQEFEYDVTNDSVVFYPFFDGVKLNSSIWDDPSYEFSSGFPLTIDGKDYNQIKIAPEGTGGSLRFRNSDGDQIYMAFSLVDLADRGLNNPPKSKSSIRYKTLGGPGNKIFIIQYYNCGFFDPINDLDDASDFIHLQIRFYEATDAIEIAYGDRNLPNYSKIIAATQGNSIAFFEGFDSNFYPENVWYLTNSPELPELEYVMDGQSLPNLWQAEPLENRVIRFTPQLSSISKGEIVFDKMFNLFQSEQSLIFSSSRGIDQATYGLFDMSGKQVLTGRLVEQVAQISVQNLTTGTYLFVVNAPEGTSSRKVYIQKQR
jgi:hypothetical protein